MDSSQERQGFHTDMGMRQQRNWPPLLNLTHVNLKGINYFIHHPQRSKTKERHNSTSIHGQYVSDVTLGLCVCKSVWSLSLLKRGARFWTTLLNGSQIVVT